MADDKRGAERGLQELLTMVGWHRNDQAAYRDKGDTAGVERCEWLLKLDYAHIREHCAEHGLELPHDVPDEGIE